MATRVEMVMAEVFLRVFWRMGPKGHEEPTPSVLRRAAEVWVAGETDHAAAILSRHAGCCDAPPAVEGDPDYWPESGQMSRPESN